jgi:hypothetical protein
LTRFFFAKLWEYNELGVAKFGLLLAASVSVMNIIAGLSSLPETTSLTLLGFALITFAVFLRKRFGSSHVEPGAPNNHTLKS